MADVFPKIEAFEYFFSTLRRSIRHDDIGYEEIQLIEYTSYFKSDGSKVDHIGKSIFVKIDSLIKADAVLKIINKHFDSINHVSNEKVGRIVLYLFTFLPRNMLSVQSINQLLSMTSTADLNQFLISSKRNSTDYNFTLKDFHFGTLDSSKLKEYCDRFGTDYFEKNKSNLIGNYSLTRKYFKIPLLKFQELKPTSMMEVRLMQEALGVYYNELADIYKVEFERDFKVQQELLTFFCKEYLDLYDLKLALYPSQHLSIFLNIGGKRNEGWIIAMEDHFQLSLGHTSELINVLEIELVDRYKFSGYGSNEIDNVFKRFSSFCATAQRLRNKHQFSECFLQYIIALEIVVGERSAPTQSVTNRVACLTYKRYGSSLKDQIDKVSKLYGLRSNYVHDGKHIPEIEIEPLRIICISVMESYFKLRSTIDIESLSLDDWMKKIDAFIASLNGGIELDPLLMEKFGVLSSEP